MKKELSNLLMLLLVVLAVICFSVGFTSCGVFLYEEQSYTQDHPIYTQWKLEQKAQNDALLKYTQSDEFKKKYGGTSYGNNKDGVRAGSIVGTSADPMSTIRQPGMGVYPTIGVRVYK